MRVVNMVQKLCVYACVSLEVSLICAFTNPCDYRELVLSQYFGSFLFRPILPQCIYGKLRLLPAGKYSSLCPDFVAATINIINIKFESVLL